MNDEKENPDWQLEELLRQVSLPAPSSSLDRRIAKLFHPRWSIVVGPLAGFGAGIAATIAAFILVPSLRAHTPLPQTTPIERPAAALAPRPALLIRDDQVHALADGIIDGHQVRIERTVPHWVVLRKTETGALWRADVDLPPQISVRTVQSN